MIKTIIRLIKGTGKFIAGKAVNREVPNTEQALTTEVDETMMEDLVNRSPLRVITHPVYMHYGLGTTEAQASDISPEALQHTADFFWQAEEAFERKSLPDSFKALPCHYFIFLKLPVDLSLTYGAAIPWFGQPGGGTKYCVRRQGQPVSLAELKRLGIITEVAYETLHSQHLLILQDRDRYVIQIRQQDLDTATHRVMDASGKPLSLYQAIKQGKAHLLKMVGGMESNRA